MIREYERIWMEVSITSRCGTRQEKEKIRKDRRDSSASDERDGYATFAK